MALKVELAFQDLLSVFGQQFGLIPQRWKDKTVTWQQPTVPLPCKFCNAKDPMPFFDESDSEHPAWQYLCGCGVSGPRAKEKAIALEYWNIANS